jgi:very-short-patch-repair endonuclease
VARNLRLDELVHELARCQHGAFTLHQLGDAGDRRVAARRVARREWARFTAGTYLLPTHLDEWSAAAAMCLHVPSAVLAGPAAARWWGIAVPRSAPVTLLVPTTCGVRHPMVRRSGDLLPHEIRTEPAGRLRVTDPTRTIIDVAALCDLDELERVVEPALRRRLTSAERLRHRASQLKGPGRRGPVRVLQALERRPAGESHSDGEVLLLQALRAHGVPSPVRQLRLGPWRFDLAWPASRLLVELDGGHHRSSSQLRADNRKQNAAVLQGWTVLRFTWDRIEHDLTAVVAEILSALS